MRSNIFKVSYGEEVEMKYVDRGDPGDPDFTEANLSADAAWHELDLSGIVAEAGANHLVHLSLQTYEPRPGEPSNEVIFKARKLGNINMWNLAIADKIICTDLWVMVDANRKIEYWLETISGSGKIGVTIRGWVTD